MAARVLACYTLCILLCSLHGIVTAEASYKKPLHLIYYAHEIHSGPNATLIVAAGTGEGNFSGIGWGSFLVFDNAMKAGAPSDSLVLGQITGTVITTASGRGNGGPLMNAQHLFSGSKYNGSSLTLIGNILTATPPFECIVVGGTGSFRGYSGYGILSPVLAYTKEPNYVYEWDIHITYKK